MIIQEESTRTTSTSTGEAGVSLTATSPIRIWLVDDDDRLRSIVAEWLKRFEGIECTGDFNSPNAVLSALASKQGPDVILLDVQMGELSGLDAVRPIRSLSRSTRVVMFTSSFDGERRQRALDDGASDFLLKFNPLEEVVARIRELAREPAPVMRRRRAQVTGCDGGLGGGERKGGWFRSRPSAGNEASRRGDRPQRKRLLNRYLDMFMGARD
jgi:CheY-like chemotaxis protein